MGEFTYALDIPPGVFPEDTPYSQKGRWADCSGIRFLDGRPQAIGGRTSLRTLAGGSLLLQLGWAADRLIYGAQTKLYAGSFNAVPTDITPAAVGSVSDWSFASWGGTTLLAASVSGKLYEWSGSGVATEVTEAPDAIAKILVTPQRQVLAFNTNEVVSGTVNRRLIRGSDLEDYSSAGSWTPSASNNSFEDVLDDPGLIVTAELVGDYVGVWTNCTLWFGTFIGDPAQTYRWDRVDTVPGPISQNAATVVGQVAYWVGRDWNFYYWSPGQPVRRLPCPFFRDLRLYAGNAKMYWIPHFNEIWFHYTDSRDSAGPGLMTRYVMFSLNGPEPVWARGTMSIVTALSGGPLIDSMGSYDDGAYLVGTSPLTVQVQGHGAPTDTWFIRSADAYLEDGRRRAMVKRFVPDFEEQTQSVDLTLYVRARPRSNEVEKGPYAIATDATKKDFRASGKLMSAKLSGTGHWRMGRPTFDCVTLGER